MPAVDPPVTVLAGDVPPAALAEIDRVLDTWSARRRAFRRQQVEADDERREFIRHAEGLAGSVVRPSLQAIAARLKACSGDARLVERRRDPFQSLRLTLWMALDSRDRGARSSRPLSLSSVGPRRAETGVHGLGGRHVRGIGLQSSNGSVEAGRHHGSRRDRAGHCHSSPCRGTRRTDMSGARPLQCDGSGGRSVSAYVERLRVSTLAPLNGETRRSLRARS